MKNIALLMTAALAPAAMWAAIKVDLTGYRAGPPGASVRVEQQGETLVVDWTDEASRPWRAVFSLDPEAALIREMATGSAPVIENAQPIYAVTTGRRRGGWDAFFDHPGRRPEEMHSATGRFLLAGARARSAGNRVEVSFDGLHLGLFSGAVAYTFFPRSRLVQQEAVVRAGTPDLAYYYDTGLRTAGPPPRLAWYDTSGQLIAAEAGQGYQAWSVRHRMVGAGWKAGSLALFPAPHQYFFARDVTTNLGHLWRRAGPNFLEMGVRQLADDGTRFYPWMNAPPGTEQRMALFLILGAGASAAERLRDALRYTNEDRFPVLPGYQTMATHWHFGYAVRAMREGFDKIPFFKPVLKQMGINIAMIMDFHGDGHPQDTGQVRLEELDALFEACRAQSDPEFLILPAEEANVHLGGHWALFFPRPVYWYHRRPEGRPFVTTDPRRGNLYSTGSAADMLELVRREQGLMWQTHPRTKGSTGYPDLIRHTDYFLDPRYFGAGWKQMPSDLSSPRLGERSFRLLDDMNNWGLAKRLLGEVDVFRIDETHELYAHMNVNYLRLPSLPSFDNYAAVAQALEKGDYFVTTGEVLIPEHSIEYRDGRTRARASLRWTFPLRMAEAVWGDGVYTKRRTIALAETPAFGRADYEWEIPAGEWKWMRLAVWDVAANGAFTLPVRRQP